MFNVIFFSNSREPDTAPTLSNAAINTTLQQPGTEQDVLASELRNIVRREVRKIVEVCGAHMMSVVFCEYSTCMKYIAGLLPQDCSNSIADTLDLPKSCTELLNRLYLLPGFIT